MSDRRRRTNAAATAGHRTMPWLLVSGMVLTALAALYVVLAGNGGAAFAEDDVDPDDVTVLAAGDDVADEDVDEVGFVPAGVTHDVFLSRDPFDPVVPEPVSTAGDGGTTTDPGGTTTDPTDPDGTTTPIDSPAPGCTGTQELVCAGRVVTLIGITSVDGEPRAILQVDVNTYEVAEGQIFAEVFQLRSIDGDCVTLLYGDEAFPICTGDRVLK